MAKPTGELLTKLRSAMKNKAYVPDVLQAYIIPTEDAHQVMWTRYLLNYFTISWSFCQQLCIRTVHYVHHKLKKAKATDISQCEPFIVHLLKIRSCHHANGAIGTIDKCPGWINLMLFYFFRVSTLHQVTADENLSLDFLVLLVW